MSDAIRDLRERHPLLLIMLAAIAFRLIAAIFSRGYMASDDHFQVVELAARWMRGELIFLDGVDRFYRTLLYPGFHWVVMTVAHRVGIFHPDAVMTIVRVLLGTFSLWAVPVAYRYGEALGGRSLAWVAGWLVAAHAIMPYTAVRSLVETAALPFLLYSLYRLHLAHTGARRGWITPFVAGIAFGGAFVFRVHVMTAGFGIGAYFLWQRQFRILALWILGAAIPIAGQGLWDLSLHGVFLGSAAKYLAFNRENLQGYVVGPIYRYFLTVMGAFLPPFGILFFLAMFKRIREQGVLFWAAMAFLIAHAVIPQKQERFLLPIMPELALMGAFGLRAWALDAGPTLARWIRIGWRYFWVLNTAILLVAMLHYGQKARIEPFVELYERGDATSVVLDLTERAPGIPKYYLDGARRDRGLPRLYEVREPEAFSTLRAELLDAHRERGAGGAHPDSTFATLPNYVVVFSGGRIDEHVATIDASLAGVNVVYHSQPKIIDRVLRAVNGKYNHSKESWLGRLEWDDARDRGATSERRSGL